VADLREPRERFTPDALSGRVGCCEFGMDGLELGELTVEGVVVRVGDLRAVQDVVAVLMMPDEVPKPFQPARYLRVCRYHSAPPS
jgi:hypothetical protein